MRTNHRARASAPAHLGFLLDELRSAGVTTYADLAATLNRQGIRPARGRWTAHDLHLAMRRHRRAHPGALLNVGAALYARRADEARRVMRRLQRRGLRTQAMIARALNARGLTTPGYGHPWTARTVSRVLAAGRRAARNRKRSAKPTLH
jgi:hypothetical protein